MNNTGIIRRIDDLGRVVIPKEIRRNLRIREGDPLEIHVNNNMVCFKKYEPEIEYIDNINQILANLEEDFDMNDGKRNILRSKMEEIILLLKEK